MGALCAAYKEMQSSVHAVVVTLTPYLLDDANDAKADGAKADGMTDH